MSKDSITWGLSTQSAKARLVECGPNEILTAPFTNFLTEFIKVVKDPMGLMLLSLGSLYWILGDKTDSLILIGAYVPITAVDVVLELRSGRLLRALNSGLQSKAKIYRDGAIKDLPTRDIVPGDILVFEEGQVLPADGTVVKGEYLHINEALVTGESEPVIKKDQDLFIGGTIVLSGHGLGLVRATGKNSKYGAMAKLLLDLKGSQSPLKKKVNRLVRIIVVAALFVAGGLFFLEWHRSNQVIPSLIIALTLGMAAIPEEFPLVYTLYLSLGAWRLSRKGVLVKTLPSVETLGGVDVICTDKTGTLTEGLFKLEELRLQGDTYPISTAWKLALMACELHPVDSLETAIFDKAGDNKSLLEGWKLLYDYPFELEGKHMSHVWENTSTGEKIISMKGALEGVLEHCQLSGTEANKIYDTNSVLTNSGKRVLGLAARQGACVGDRTKDETNLNFVGFLCFSDPVRLKAKEAIAHCQKEGVEIKMLTGDHLLTAHAVANQLGLKHSHSYLFTGQQLSQMSQKERESSFMKGALFARLLPEQKYEMVQSLQASGKIVAMTGDGVNDAPALRLADIGVSMGVGATDLARASAKMVLLTNDFSGIVDALFEGRKIFSNLRRSFSYLISFHIPVILLATVPPYLGWRPLFLPMHIILLELVVHPISAFTFENMEGNRSEKNTKEGFLNRRQTLSAVFSGLILSFGSLWIFNNSWRVSESLARTLAMETLLFGNIFFVFIHTVSKINRRLLWTVISLTLLTLVIAFNPGASQFLHYESLQPGQLILPFLLSATVLLPALTTRCFR